MGKMEKNKKISKKQKIILTIGIVFLIIVGFRPALEQIEMRKVNLDNQLLSKNQRIYVQALTDIEITGQKIYANYDENYKVAKGSVVLLYLINNRFCRQKDEKQCFPKDKFKILSTQKDQNLILTKIRETYSETSVEVLFIDLNNDDIDDLVFNQKNVVDESDMYRQYLLYSAERNKVLWGYDIIAAHCVDEIGCKNPELKVINTYKQSPIILVYEPFSHSKNVYSFYKVVDNHFKLIVPDSTIWKEYWNTISTTELRNRFLSLDIFLILVLFFLCLFAILVILILLLTGKILNRLFQKIKKDKKFQINL